MKSLCKRFLCLCLCIVLMGTLLPWLPAQAADAADVIDQLHYGEYDTLSIIYNQGDCFSMQGMTLDSNYTYCAKVNTDTDASCCIIRSSKTNGSKTVMINSATGGYYFSNLGHANALDTAYANGYNQLFVTAGATLVRLTMNGSYLTTAGTYTATLNGASASMTAVQVMSASDEEIKVLVKTGRTLYTGTLDPRVSSGNIELVKLCTLNLSSARLKGQIYDFSSYVQQGFDFHDNKLFLPLSSNTADNTSIVLVYDLEGATGDIRNDPTLSFRVISGTYSALFEIEDVAICQETGRLYFNTNRRKTNSDTDHDSCSYFLGYSYDPSMSTIAPADYRWETVNDELISTSMGGGTYNLPTQFHGTIKNNTMTQGLFSLSRSVMLKHNAPWVVEWRSSGSFSGGAMLLASAKNSKVPNQPFLFRYKESHIVSLGYYTGSQHNNYGIKLSDHGIDGTADHVYRLTNKISADGSNMVYLSVDGKELGAMNNYYIGINSQGTTSNWVSGKDFTFSYIGSYNHPLTCKLDYLQVWADGVPKDNPDVFRWESTGDKLTAASGSGLTQNIATLYNGSVSGTTYTNACFRLDQSMVLLHDRPWSLEWKSEGSISGGTFLLSAAEGAMTKNAPFIFRYGNSGLIVIGMHDGTRHSNYGLNLSDYGIDSTQSHVYRLTNKIASDGSNMIYLYVDNVQLGAMNNQYNGLNSLGTTSDWVSGKDFVFDYIGNIAYAMKGSYDYIQLWENGKPEETTYLVEFRNYNGDLLSSRYYTAGQTVEVPADPMRKNDSKYSYTFIGWSPAVTEAVANVTYMATYSSTLNVYTITFQNDDGSVLSTQNLTYGEMPTAPANPTKESSGGTTYTFIGWDKAISKVKGNEVYTAQYSAEASTCTIVFKDDDGTVLSTQVLAYGETPVAPAAPTKAPTVSHSYSFVGWDAAIVPATGDMVYTARYASSVRKYTVTFKNTDGTVLSTQLVPYGYSPTAPTATPSRTPDSSYHYTFSGWSPAIGNISGNTTYTAAYTSTAHGYRSTTTSATCTTSGRTTYTCSTCGYSYSKTLPALGHSYTNGVCTLCGGKDPNYAPSAPTITLRYPTVSFEDVIVMNVYYAASNLQNVQEMGLITYSSEVSAPSVATAEHVVPGYTYNSADGLYFSSTAGIAPKDIGDTIYFSVYSKLTDGTYSYTPISRYSPKTYAMNLLAGSNEEMKPLVVAMLNYGAAAQTYFNYKTDSLMNADLTSAQRGLVEGYRADMIDSVVQASPAKAGAFVNNGGYTRRYPTISFEGAFCINYYYIPNATVKGNVTMYVWNQADFSKAVTLTKNNATKAITMTKTASGEYTAAVEGIAAKDLDKAVYVSFCYSDGTTNYCDGITGYTIGMYCKAQAAGTGIMANLASACAVYGYYAKQLFYK